MAREIRQGGFERETLASPRVPRLSPRETQVLSLLCEGMEYKEIARCLRISVGAVGRYCHDLYLKLGAGNCREALAMARSRGLLPLGELPPCGVPGLGFSPPNSSWDVQARGARRTLASGSVCGAPAGGGAPGNPHRRCRDEKSGESG
jgi:DNA-binding CsgD family transcriptional regulator